MTVTLRFNDRLSDVDASTAATTISELDDIDGTSSSTSGTYDVHFVRYQYVNDNQSSELHFAVSLTDSDDSDYPHVKDDLADTIVGLTADFGAKSEIKETLSGDVQ